MDQVRDQFLHPGEVKILDGGTGTELQKRGVRMASQAWSGPAALESRSILQEIHRDYIEAGADIVIANTYATSRQVLAIDGLDASFEVINKAAVSAAQAAKQECGRSDVLIAGSLSHRGTIAPGSATPQRGSRKRADEMYAALSELAVLLREEGCDLIVLEMLYDPELMPAVFAAAAESNLPIWAGFSARRGPGGEVLGFSPDPDTPFEDVVSILNTWKVAAAGVMHTPSDLTSDALRIVQNVFDGPLMAYPDSGYFKSPHWEFEDIIAPDDLRRFAEQWIEEGVQIVGGCCGLGPKHIKALSSLRQPPLSD